MLERWEDAIDDIGRTPDLDLVDFDQETDENGSRCYAVYSAGRDTLTFFAYSNGSVALEVMWLSPVSGNYNVGPTFTDDDPVDTASGWHKLLRQYRRLMEH